MTEQQEDPTTVPRGRNGTPLGIVPRQRCSPGQCAAEQSPVVVEADRGWRDRALTIGGLLAIFALAWAAYQAYATMTDRLVQARSVALSGHNRAADSHPDVRRLMENYSARMARRLDAIEAKLDRLLEGGRVQRKRR